MFGDAWKWGRETVRGFDIGLDLAGFSTRLAQTIAWCRPRALPKAPATSLRTAALCPPLLSNNRDAAVRFVGVERERALGPLAPERRDYQTATPDLHGGRLLLYFPDANLSDGAAAAESQGFFDVFNTPPWDTWVGYFEDPHGGDRSYANYLVCYAPLHFFALAEAGIRVNPEECIVWALSAKTELTAILQGMKLA
ncbi:MAG TPA: hypothetical protein VGN42_16235 [Pirellulales bacterium]|jgi:hypothetical protein|nr:hypothetical protein [Pirellulales bacterium]